MNSPKHPLRAGNTRPQTKHLSSDPTMPTERYEQIRTFSFLTIVTIIFMINIRIIFNIIKKCKNKFEPINVFWLNYFLITSLLMCFWFLIVVDASFNILTMFFNFCPQNFFGLFVFISFNLDVTSMQIRGGQNIKKIGMN